MENPGTAIEYTIHLANVQGNKTKKYRPAFSWIGEQPVQPVCAIDTITP
jgi:hypothetical protein